MRTLDRYLIRETIPPFLLALSVFTFVLAINPMLDYAKDLLAKGVPVPTVGVLLLMLLPQSLSLTMPMAFLTGLLMAMGRLSGDRESVALLACGVSPLRLLRTVLLLGIVVGGLDMFILMKVKPDANQTYREIAMRLLTEQTAGDIKPRVFFEHFPGMVLYVGDVDPGGGWTKVLLADTSDPGRPVVTLAESGSLAVDREQRQVRLVLRNATQYTPGTSASGAYSTSRQDPVSIRVTADAVFGTGDISRGNAERTYADLSRAIEAKRAAGESPHNEVLHQQQMFSFPVACVVFAVLGLALGLNTRKDGRLAGLTLGLVVIVAYYAIMTLAEAWTKGEAWRGGPTVPAELARWVPNVVLGLVGVAALWWRGRGSTFSWVLLRPAWQSAGEQDEAPMAGTAGRRVSRPVVAIRLPHVRLPAPRLLDRYVSREYLKVGGLAFIGLLALYYIGASVDLAEKLFKGQATGGMLLRFLWYSTPQFIAFVLPIATLIAVLGTIGALTRSGELMVMRACGVSLYRAALPLLILAVAWSGLLFVLEERVLGESNRTAQGLRDTIRGRVPHTVNVANHNWMIADDGRIYHYAVFDMPRRMNASPPTIYGLSIFETADRPYRMTRHTHATQATYAGGNWQARNGWTQEFSGDEMPRRDFDQTALEIAPVEDFRRTQIDASQMTFGELREYVRRLGASGFNVAEQQVNLHRKIAFPIVTLVMTLIAVPFGVTTGKKGALYGIGLAVILAAAYFLLLTFFVAVGAAGVLPAWLAAWAANLLFAAGALYLMLTVRT